MYPPAVIDALSETIDALKAQLAACEVQRDALRDACRALRHWGQGSPGENGLPTLALAGVEKMAESALAMSPANAASVIAERDRYKEALENIASPSSEHMWRAGVDVPAIARQALATKGESVE